MKTNFKKFANKLIRRVLTLLGFSSSLAFMACYGPAMSDQILEVNPDTIRFNASGKEKQNIQVLTQEPWKVVEQSKFVELNITKGEGNKNLEIVATPNDQKRERQGLIVVEAGNDSTGIVHDTVVVVQAPK